MAQWNLVAGWSGMMFGLISGAAVGLFFHDEHFAGGYGAFRRRLLRLGHVSFFGLGIINVVFAMTLITTGLIIPLARVASISLIAGAVLMPTVCYLAAWRKPFRHLFAIPVSCVALTLTLLLAGLVSA